MFGIDIIFRIAGIGIIIAIVNQILKKVDREEITTLTTLAGVIIVLLMVLDMISQLFSTLRNMFGLF
ncbi:MAG: stage III sporulation protein AC [Firmicutes bacterium]|nr:stage III sporulation protein AC [Bacillota bacterium]MCL1944928.1 stage III sporulation protein AC [Bacillota bacterium]MCL1954258.1 stage III sporulation protein AC [Bacillota bacterium]